MNIYANIEQLNAADLAALLPMLEISPDTAAGKLVKTLRSLPEPRLRGFLEAIPGEALLDVLSTAAEEYQSILLPALEKLAHARGLPMQITGFSLSAGGQICLQTGAVDYPTILRSYRTVILSGNPDCAGESPLLQMFLAMLRLSLNAGLAALSRIPARSLDTMAAGLINGLADTLSEKLNAALAEKGFLLRLSGLHAEK